MNSSPINGVNEPMLAASRKPAKAAIRSHVESPQTRMLADFDART